MILDRIIHNKKLLIFDMDGTLLFNETLEISWEDISTK